MKLTKKAGAVVLACVLTCITSVGVGYLWGSHTQEHAAVKDVADLPMYSWCSLSTLRDATDAGYGVEGSENQCYQPVVGTMEFQKKHYKVLLYPEYLNKDKAFEAFNTMYKPWIDNIQKKLRLPAFKPENFSAWRNSGNKEHRYWNSLDELSGMRFLKELSIIREFLEGYQAAETNAQLRKSLDEFDKLAAPFMKEGAPAQLASEEEEASGDDAEVEMIKRNRYEEKAAELCTALARTRESYRPEISRQYDNKSLEKLLFADGVC